MGTWGRRRYLAVRHTTTTKPPRLHAEYWCTTISGSVSRNHFGVQEVHRQPVTIPFVLHCFVEGNSERAEWNLWHVSASMGLGLQETDEG